MSKPSFAILAVLAAAGAANACLPADDTCSCAMTFDFDPAGAGIMENRFVAGAASVCYDDTSMMTTVQFIVLFLRPNTTYGVSFTSDNAGFETAAAFTTNWFGAAMFTDDGTIGDSTGNPNITIYIDDNENGFYDAGEERAVTDNWF